MGIKCFVSLLFLVGCAGHIEPLTDDAAKAARHDDKADAINTGDGLTDVDTGSPNESADERVLRDERDAMQTRDVSKGAIQRDTSFDTDGVGCGEAFIDYNCEAVFDPCPEGTHRDYDPSSACPVCLENSTSSLSCDAARARYRAFFTHIVSSSCADFCETAADCRKVAFDNACARHSAAIFGNIDEEVIEAAAQFARETCAPVCLTDPPNDSTTQGVKKQCIDHKCRLLNGLWE